MKLAVVQMDCEVGNIDGNLKKISGFAERAAHNGCDLVVFPEMADSGYDLDIIRTYAAAWDSKHFQAMAGIASSASIHLAVNFAEKTEGGIYNSTAVFNPEGKLITRYRKVHLAAYPPLSEERCFQAGDRTVLFEMNGIKIGLMICYDLRFPEMARTLAEKGADVLLLSAAWPFPRNNHWNILVKTRAIENQLYVVAANRCGIDGGAVLCGSSQIVDPYGIIKAGATEIFEELLTAEIDLNLVRTIREAMPVFKHRRQDIYFRQD